MNGVKTRFFDFFFSRFFAVSTVLEVATLEGIGEYAALLALAADAVAEAAVLCCEFSEDVHDSLNLEWDETCIS